MTTASPGWNKDNVALLKDFLESGTGSLFLTQLASRRPSLLTTNENPNAVALAAQLVAGYEKAIAVISNLSTPLEADEVVTDSENYPNLDAPASPEELDRFLIP